LKTPIFKQLGMTWALLVTPFKAYGGRIDERGGVGLMLWRSDKLT